MSGVLHPIGPEPERVYWVRRLIVAAAAVILVVLLVVIISNLGNAARADGPEAVPAPAGSTSAPEPDPTSASISINPTPRASSRDSGGAEAGRSSGGSSSGSASATTPRGTSSASGAASAPSKASAGGSSKASTATSPSTAFVAWCPPNQLRQTLTGPQGVKVRAKAEFKLSLINGSGQSCRVKVDASRFELTVYSGTDRIWSTADCPSQIQGATQTLADQDAYEWRQVWNGLRSIRPCKARPEIPRPGTYWATAQYDGAQPVRFRMILS